MEVEWFFVDVDWQRFECHLYDLSNEAKTFTYTEIYSVFAKMFDGAGELFFFEGCSKVGLVHTQTELNDSINEFALLEEELYCKLMQLK